MGPIELSDYRSTFIRRDTGSDDSEVQKEPFFGIGGRIENGCTPLFAIQGCRIVPWDILAKGIVTIDADKGRNMNEFIIEVTSAIDSASVASALSRFRFASGTSGELLVRDGLNDLAAAAASSDLAAVGRLLGPQDVSTVCFNEGELPASLVRRPLKCSLLDVAVGSGSVEMTKYLFEFHGAKATWETLKQSISTGDLELIKLMRERLPKGEVRDRVELMEVAVEFHQEEVLAWLLRDATVFERELLGVFALERKLAASLKVALENGFHPWWSSTREVSLRWRASSEMEFVSAPGFFRRNAVGGRPCRV
jgi:hypothetical protein